ncbi:MAG: LptE family protein [Bacteroidales bacterium]|nr:LptE family protein [Bacteroidales bacterium]
MKKKTGSGRICIILLLSALVPLLAACGIYSFTGTSIAPDVKSISIYTIENRAMKVNPALSNTFTNALQDKFRRLTKLEMYPEGGDLEISGMITNYDITPTAVTSNEVASQNRLTITVKITFTNNKHEEESFKDKSFAAFQDYDSNLSIDAVEASLCDDIVEILVEDIFNATVANW